VATFWSEWPFVASLVRGRLWQLFGGSGHWWQLLVGVAVDGKFGVSGRWWQYFGEWPLVANVWWVAVGVIILVRVALVATFWWEWPLVATFIQPNVLYPLDKFPKKFMTIMSVTGEWQLCTSRLIFLSFNVIHSFYSLKINCAFFFLLSIYKSNTPLASIIMTLKDRSFDLEEFSMFCFATNHFFSHHRTIRLFRFWPDKRYYFFKFYQYMYILLKTDRADYIFSCICSGQFIFFLLNLATFYHVQLCKPFLNTFKGVLIFVICSNTHTIQVMLFIQLHVNANNASTSNV
jgi:hypothetical protein